MALSKRPWASLFQVDPGHVRRKFYERALACGFPKELGGPEALRKSRAVELLQNNVPLPVVQSILGHSTPNLTAALVSFSEAEMHQVARFFLNKESGRKTSARNNFFGKISSIRKGDIQAKVEMITLGGDRVTTVITNDSLSRLGLKVGKLITAEVKAPWVVLQKGDEEPECSAENRFRGTIARINKGRVTTEYVVQIADGTELCAIVSSDSSRTIRYACKRIRSGPYSIALPWFCILISRNIRVAPKGLSITMIPSRSQNAHLVLMGLPLGLHRLESLATI